jgi:hypothetical protein
VTTAVKACSACLKELPVDQFHKHPTGTFGVRPECKTCRCLRERLRKARPGGKARQRELGLLRNYGLSQEDWSRLFVSQGSRCAICLSDSPGPGHGWATDHDHKTGKVRGILCNPCNRGLGMFLDSPQVMRVAAQYLTRDQLHNRGTDYR